MTYSAKATYRELGAPLSEHTGFFSAAWEEFIELQVMDKEAWVCMSVQSIQERPRYEFVVHDDERPIGGCILTHDTDGHVGSCMSVMFNYVLPEHRNRRLGAVLFREAVRLTRAEGYRVLAYTHRVRDWEYVTKYRMVR